MALLPVDIQLVQNLKIKLLVLYSVLAGQV